MTLTLDGTFTVQADLAGAESVFNTAQGPVIYVDIGGFPTGVTKVTGIMICMIAEESWVTSKTTHFKIYEHDSTETHKRFAWIVVSINILAFVPYCFLINLTPIKTQKGDVYTSYLLWGEMDVG